MWCLHACYISYSWNWVHAKWYYRQDNKLVLHQLNYCLPRRVATQARMARRAAVLSPGEGSVDCWGRHTASRSQSHSPSVCLSFSFSPARAPPLRQGQTDTVTVPVLVSPDVPSLRTSGTKSVWVEDAERDRGWSWDSSTRLAVGPGGRVIT